LSLFIPFDSDGQFCPIGKTQTLRRAAVRGAGASIAGQASGFAVQIGSVVILARILSPADFGIVTMVTTFSLLFSSFGRNGFMELVMQREEISHSLASNLFWLELGIGAILTLALACSGPLLVLFYHYPEVAHVTEGLSLTIVIGCLGWIHMGLLQRAMRFRTTAFISFLGQLVLAIVSIVLAMEGWHYWALVWGSVAQNMVIAASAWSMCRWIPSWPSRVSGTRSGFKFAMNVYAHFAFSYSTRNTDNLLVGWRFGARSLGFYKKAYDLFVLPQSQLLSPISAVAVSTLSRVNRDHQQFKRYFLRFISVLALLGMGIGVDLALVGNDLIRFLLGPGWEEAGRIFTLFGPGIGVMLLYETHGWVHLSIGQPERWFRWGLVEFACTATLFLLALRWGPSGIALAWTISYFVLMLPGFWYAGKPIRLSIGPVLDVIWRYFAASVSAGLATLVIVRGLAQSSAISGAVGSFVRMVSVSFVFFVLYLIGVIALHRGLGPIQETARLLRELLPNRVVESASSEAAGAEKVRVISTWDGQKMSQPDAPESQLTPGTKREW